MDFVDFGHFGDLGGFGHHSGLDFAADWMLWGGDWGVGSSQSRKVSQDAAKREAKRELVTLAVVAGVVIGGYALMKHAGKVHDRREQEKYRTAEFGW